MTLAQEAGDFSNVERGFLDEATTNDEKNLLYKKSSYIFLSLTSDASFL